MSEYQATIGIEVHAELKTKSKMFCGCANNPHGAAPNTLICPVCTAQPGTLPVVNQQAVAFVRKVGVAIGASLTDYSEFDRKNYFYPDIPKAYQISQYAYPLVIGGELDGVAITRIHLEEDTARSQHDQSESSSLVDFNRAGVPLMELVTEPVIHSAEAAAHFAKELQLLLRTLGVSDANMERGEMRVEANISISQTSELGTKVEVKNLNSFKAVASAVAYEIKRQTTALEKGEVIIQETRGWDDNKSRTFSQRSKETAEDYRYFPDPDIPKYQFSGLSNMSSSSLAENMPILPNELRSSLQSLDISDSQVEVLVSQEPLREYFMAGFSLSDSSNLKRTKLAANYLTSDVVSLLQGSSVNLSIDSADNFVKLIDMLIGKKITSRAAKDMLREVVFDNHDPQNIAEEKGLLQKNSAEDLLPIVQSIIAENPDPVADVKAGKEAVIKFLVGQGMKATKGSANPVVLESLLREEIGVV